MAYLCAARHEGFRGPLTDGVPRAAGEAVSATRQYAMPTAVLVTM